MSPPANVIFPPCELRATEALILIPPSPELSESEYALITPADVVKFALKTTSLPAAKVIPLPLEVAVTAFVMVTPPKA